MSRSKERVKKPLHPALSHPSLFIGAIMTAAVIGLALIALVWTPYDPTIMNMAQRLQGPSSAHWLGTDRFGRDVLSMAMEGAVISLKVSFAAIVLGMAFGVPLGLLAAMRGGSLDEAAMRLSDFIFAFPALLTAIMLRELFGPGALNAMVAIGIFNVPVFARVTYGAALSLYTRDYVTAARLAGKNERSIAFDHILPNLLPLLIVQSTIQLSLGILAEAALSYIGLGVQPPAPSWGRMLNDAQTLMAIAPRLAFVPGLCIVFTVLALNLLGDGLRDWLDPRMWRRPS